MKHPLRPLTLALLAALAASIFSPIVSWPEASPVLAAGTPCTRGFTAAPGSPFASGGGQPISLATGNYNGDVNADLAVVNVNSATASLLLGNGSGGFTQPVGSPFFVGTNPIAVATADFDGRYGDDLAVSDYQNHDIKIFLNEQPDRPAGDPGRQRVSARGVLHSTHRDWSHHGAAGGDG